MNTELLLKELTYKAVRSSGPGGQHVNKTASKVEVYFNISESNALSEEEKERLFKKLATKIYAEGNLKLSSSETRSQHKNKVLVTEKLIRIIKNSLIKQTPRKKTKRTRSSIEKRLNVKKYQEKKKQNRKPPKFE